MGVRYDAAIIGAGADGLTAAAVLARAGLKTVMLERTARSGGRLLTETFHPGFRASPFADRVSALPALVSALLSPRPELRITALPDDIETRRSAVLDRLMDEAGARRHGWGFLHGLGGILAPVPPIFPGRDLATRRRADWPCDDEAALAPADPDLAGSALALLARSGAEPRHGGLGSLANAFAAAASGAEFRGGREAREVMLERGRVAGVITGDGGRIAADAVISTLDFKRSVLSLFAGTALPPALLRAAAVFRMEGSRARLLLALRRPVLKAPVLLAGSRDARAAWRHGAVPERPPLLADPVSLRDTGLAPAGAAVVTVTLGLIPFRPFEGAWSKARRLSLAAWALARLEAARPGLVAALMGLGILVPPDIEERLGISGGDLDGGALAPDQMLDMRPGARTPLEGFYLGGRSTAAGPLGTGAAGLVAATALLADRA